MNTHSLDIAFIDDGINSNLFNIGSLKHNIEICEDLKIKGREEYSLNLISHGTLCAAITKMYSPKVIISSIKILDSASQKCGKRQLIRALYWCVENDIKIVNVSLGSIDYRDFKEVKDCINNVTKFGLIVIAAFSNMNVYTVPASLTNVIGVNCSKSCSDDEYLFHRYAMDGIDVSASGSHYLYDLVVNSYYTGYSNSYSAPVISGKVYEILLNYPDSSLEDIKEELYKGSKNYRDEDYNPYICVNTDWIENIIEIDEYFHDDLQSSCETFVFNAVENLEKYIKSGRVCSNSRGKNIICICSDKLSKREYDMLLMQKGVKIWYDEFYKTHLAQTLPRELIQINIPVVAIYDSEIAFKLSSLFLDDGYYSVVVSTECRDMLYGCEYIPQGIDVNRFLFYVVQKYSCDMLLLNIDNKRSSYMMRKSVECDIEIYISDDKVKDDILIEEKKGNHYDCIAIKINRQIMKERIVNIYNQIRNMLINHTL